MIMKSQVVMQLFTTERSRAGMHKAYFRALQAIIVLTGGGGPEWRVVRPGEGICSGRREDLRPVGVGWPRAITTAAAHLRALYHDYHTSGCLRTTSGCDARTVVYKSPEY
jgi:hypothetical protein